MVIAVSLELADVSDEAGEAVLLFVLMDLLDENAHLRNTNVFVWCLRTNIVHSVVMLLVYVFEPLFRCGLCSETYTNGMTTLCTIFL